MFNVDSVRRGACQLKSATMSDGSSSKPESTTIELSEIALDSVTVEDGSAVEGTDSDAPNNVAQPAGDSAPAAKLRTETNPSRDTCNVPDKVASMTSEEIQSVFTQILNPPPMDESFGGETKVECCHIRDSVLQSVEDAMHCAVALCFLSVLVLYVPEEPLLIIAPIPFLLPIAGITATGANLGTAILKAILILWALFVGFIVVCAATLPLHCSPIAQATAFFFIMWFVRYWLSFFGTPVNMKFISAVHLIGALQSIRVSVNSETCDYGAWAPLLITYVSFGVATTIAFLSSFIPWPRVNFVDAAQINRRILRDSTRMVRASLSTILLAYHRPAFDDGDRSDPDSKHSQIDRAEAHQVQLMEHLLAHLDGDLTGLKNIAIPLTMECGGCCCPAEEGSVRTPVQNKAMQAIAAIAYAFARSSMGHRESDAISFQGKQLDNFGAHSGFFYFKLLQRRRVEQQSAVSAQVRTLLRWPGVHCVSPP